MDKQQLQQDAEYLLVKHQATKLVLHSPRFEATYILDETGNPELTRLKAVTRSHGQTKKYPVDTNLDQEDLEQVFAEADTQAQHYWSETYKRIRATQAAKQPDTKLRSKYQRERRQRRKEEQNGLYSSDRKD